MTIPAAWHPDPLQRHEYRYWDGSQWTDHVSDGGRVGHDPVAGPSPAATEASSRPQPGASAGSPAPAETEQPSAAPGGSAGSAPPSQPGPGPATATPAGPGATGSTSGIALAALIVGLLSLLVSWIPFIGLLGVVGGLVALLLGGLGRGRARKAAGGAGLAITGLVTGGLAVVLGIASTAVPVLFFQGMIGDFEAVDRCVERTGDEQACWEEHAPPWARFLENVDELDG